MSSRNYRFTGINLEITMAGELWPDNEGRLEPFRGEPSPDGHRFCFEKVERLPSPEEMLRQKEAEVVTDLPGFFVLSDGDTEIRYIGASRENWEHAYIRAEHCGKDHRVAVKQNPYTDRIGVNTVLESMAMEHLTARNHGFIFHCSYIDRKGKAILFTAPSGTGKSTQADLWAKYRGAEIINGDRAAVRLADGMLLAEGIPFAGSSQYCKNKSLPIEAIVYLGQAPKTTVRKLRGYEAFCKIWEGVSVNTWNKKDLELVSDAVQKTAERIPVFHMPCTPDESAVIALEEALRKQVSP